MARYDVLGLGAKYAGRCIKCKRGTGERHFELANTFLLRAQDGKFAVAHPECIGAHTKSAVGGGRKVVHAPETVDA